MRWRRLRYKSRLRRFLFRTQIQRPRQVWLSFAVGVTTSLVVFVLVLGFWQLLGRGRSWIWQTLLSPDGLLILGLFIFLGLASGLSYALEVALGNLSEDDVDALRPVVRQKLKGFLLLVIGILAPGWIIYQTSPAIGPIRTAQVWMFYITAVSAFLFFSFLFGCTPGISLLYKWTHYRKLLRARGWPSVWKLRRELLQLPERIWLRLPSYQEFVLTPVAQQTCRPSEHLRIALMMLYYWEKELERERWYQARKRRKGS